MYRYPAPPYEHQGGRHKEYLRPNECHTHRDPGNRCPLCGLENGGRNGLLKFFIFIWKGKVKKKSVTFNYFWSINSVKLHKSHLTRELRILGRGLSGLLTKILSFPGWQPDGSCSFAKKQSYLAGVPVHSSPTEAFTPGIFFPFLVHWPLPDMDPSNPLVLRS